MRAVIIGVGGLGALLVSFAIVSFVWGSRKPPQRSRPPIYRSSGRGGGRQPLRRQPLPQPVVPRRPFPQCRKRPDPSRQPLRHPRGVPVSVAAAPSLPGQSPAALGVSRTVEIDHHRRSGLRVREFQAARFCCSPGEVVLTFDDGPWPRNTPAVPGGARRQLHQGGLLPDRRALDVGRPKSSARWPPPATRSAATPGRTRTSRSCRRKMPRTRSRRAISAVHWALGGPAAPFLFRFLPGAQSCAPKW